MSDQGGSQVYMGSNGEFSSGCSEFHGATIHLDKDGFGNVTHVTRDGGYSKPTVRSYSDGIRVGCTFVTNEALELVYSLHQEFLKNGNSKVHQ